MDPLLAFYLSINVQNQGKYMENALSAHNTRVSAARAARGGKCCSISFSFDNMKMHPEKSPTQAQIKKQQQKYPRTEQPSG